MVVITPVDSPASPKTVVHLIMIVNHQAQRRKQALQDFQCIPQPSVCQTSSPRR